MKNKKDEIPQYVIDELASMMMTEMQKFYYGSENSEFLSKQENDNSDSSDTER